MSGPFKRLRPILGTFVEVGVEAPGVGTEAAVDEAFGKVQDVQRLMSFHDIESDLSRVNRSHGVEVRVHPLTAVVLRLARWLMHESDSLFNCTVGGKLVAQGDLPDLGGPSPIPVGSGKDWSIRGTRVFLHRPVRITLDGIAKGFAVDLAVRHLQSRGIRSGWVNAGGDMRAFGEVVVPVHRRELSGEIRALGGLKNAAIATSWVTRKSDLSFPGEIVSSGDWMPDEGIFAVMAPSAWLADALTKVAALAPEPRRKVLLERLGGRLVEHTEGPRP